MNFLTHHSILFFLCCYLIISLIFPFLFKIICYIFIGSPYSIVKVRPVRVAESVYLWCWIPYFQVFFLFHLSFWNKKSLTIETSFFLFSRFLSSLTFNEAINIIEKIGYFHKKEEGLKLKLLFTCNLGVALYFVSAPLFSMLHRFRKNCFTIYIVLSLEFLNPYISLALFVYLSLSLSIYHTALQI